MNKFPHIIKTINDVVSERKLLCLPNDAIYDWIEKNGTWEDHFTDIAKSLLNEGDICIDGGANFGWHTLIMANLVGNTGKVYSFEPLRIIFQQLNANIFFNGLDNVYTYNLALGNETGIVGLPKLDIHTTDIKNYGETSVQNEIDEFSNIIKLDNLLNTFDINNIKLIKIDVQGSELPFLKGAKSYISIFRPYLFIEIESFRFKDFGYTEQDLIHYLNYDLRYDIYKIESDYAVDHLCVPKEIPMPRITTNYTFTKL